MTELRHPETEFEHEDLSAGGILGFLAGLAITGLVIHIILVGMYAYLDTYQKTHQNQGNPLVKTTNEDMRRPTPEAANNFPLPRLEVNERSQLYDFRRQEEDTLNTYGVDPKTGVVHIPIDRAMQLLAQRGLPTVPQSAAAAKKPGESTEPANRERKHPVSNVPQQR
jgi:hypothetical protein